jgi:ribonuclease HII
MSDHRVPNLREEKALWETGFKLVCGVDEVGRGCLAGPVAAGAVILPADCERQKLKEIRDSKLLTPPERERLAVRIKRVAVCTGVGLVPPRVIDSIGILNATKLAMKKAIGSLACRPQSVLIDYLTLPDFDLPQKGVEDGDTMCLSIACASIVAKVARDAIMVKFDRIYPGYNLAGNKGYGTEEHVDRLEELGPSPIHRRSFHPKRLLPGFEEAMAEAHET